MAAGGNPRRFGRRRAGPPHCVHVDRLHDPPRPRRFVGVGARAGAAAPLQSDGLEWPDAGHHLDLDRERGYGAAAASVATAFAAVSAQCRHLRHDHQLRRRGDTQLFGGRHRERGVPPARPSPAPRWRQDGGGGRRSAALSGHEWLRPRARAGWRARERLRADSPAVASHGGRPRSWPTRWRGGRALVALAAALRAREFCRLGPRGGAALEEHHRGQRRARHRTNPLDHAPLQGKEAPNERRAAPPRLRQPWVAWLAQFA
mmetsp:Transcript_6511/g.16475  ORF Transcript_6511/g.16475 Transcript_6511/m.16475 type:complete len:260 (-) Transcript_6511:505-1284(-)